MYVQNLIMSMYTLACIHVGRSSSSCSVLLFIMLKRTFHIGLTSLDLLVFLCYMVFIAYKSKEIQYEWCEGIR